MLSILKEETIDLSLLKMQLIQSELLGVFTVLPFTCMNICFLSKGTRRYTFRGKHFFNVVVQIITFFKPTIFEW